MWFQRALRAYDVRGKYPYEVNETLARRIGLAFSKLNINVVYVGRDCRSSSRSLSKALVSGLVSSGVEVYDLGEIPNPLCYYACFRDEVYGIYITASHNPPEYNGFKFIKNDGTSMLEEYERLKEFLSKELKVKPLSEAISIPLKVIEPYLEELSKAVDDVSEVKVIAATFGGVVNKVLPKIAKEFNLKLRLLHPEIRSDFYGLRPEPTPENLQTLSEEVVKEGADFGVAFDGDGDRAVIVDNEGRVLDGSKTGYLLMSYLANKGNTVVLTPDTSSALIKLAQEMGVKITWSRIGHAFIEKEVKRHNAVLGIEQSSHFYHGYLYPFSDGLLTMLKVSEIAKQWKISELLNRVHFSPIVKLYVNVKSDDIKKEIIKRVISAIPEGIQLDDGIKIISDKGWALIRESQTMPEINICIETLSENELNMLMSEIVRAIEKFKRSSSIGEVVRSIFKRRGFLD